MPAAQAALLLLDYCGKHGADQWRHERARRQTHGTSDRIALVRHARGAAATIGGGLKDFADFRLRVERNVPRDFPESSTAKAECRGDFRHAIAMAVPRHFRQGKLKFFGEVAA